MRQQFQRPQQWVPPTGGYDQPPLHHFPGQQMQLPGKDLSTGGNHYSIPKIQRNEDNTDKLYMSPGDDAEAANDPIEQRRRWQLELLRRQLMEEQNLQRLQDYIPGTVRG